MATKVKRKGFPSTAAAKGPPPNGPAYKAALSKVRAASDAMPGSMSIDPDEAGKLTSEEWTELQSLRDDLRMRRNTYNRSAPKQARFRTLEAKRVGVAD